MAYEIDVLSAKYLNLQDSCKVQYKRLDDLTNDTKLKTEQVKVSFCYFIFFEQIQGNKRIFMLSVKVNFAVYYKKLRIIS